jgi:hypothetical protein
MKAWLAKRLAKIYGGGWRGGAEKQRHIAGSKRSWRGWQ